MPANRPKTPQALRKQDETKSGFLRQAKNRFCQVGDDKEWGRGGLAGSPARLADSLPKPDRK